MEDQKLDENRNMAGKTLQAMIAEACGYVELFLEDLENDDTVIEEPQEMLKHIMATLEYVGQVVGVVVDAPVQ